MTHHDPLLQSIKVAESGARQQKARRDAMVTPGKSGMVLRSRRTPQKSGKRTISTPMKMPTLTTMRLVRTNSATRSSSRPAYRARAYHAPSTPSKIAQPNAVQAMRSDSVSGCASDR